MLARAEQMGDDDARWEAMLFLFSVQGELSEQIDSAIGAYPAMPAWRAIAGYLAAERGDSALRCSET